MFISEFILYHGTRLFFYNSDLAHNSERKEALKSAEKYDHYRRSEFDRIADAAKRYGVVFADKRVLDLGCADGAITPAYLESGASHVVGVDISDAAIAKAAATNPHPDRITFLASKKAEIPLPDASVDVIVAYDVFEHVADVPGLLAECKRILAPGGKLLLGTWGWWHPFAPHLFSAMPFPWAHVLCSDATLIRAARRVYWSDWYRPTMHDLNPDGSRIESKYTETEFSRDYLNRYKIRDFERAFAASGMAWQLHQLGFSSSKARFTHRFLNTPWIREFITSYFWAVLQKQ